MIKKELLDDLQKCGHYLHNCKGKKFGQYRILLILSKKPGMAQKELQDFLRIKSGSISEILLKMESSGLVTRFKSEEDKRRINVKLTEVGLMKVKDLTNEYESENEALFNCLSEDECIALHDILGKLKRAWLEDRL